MPRVSEARKALLAVVVGGTAALISPMSSTVDGQAQPGGNDGAANAAEWKMPRTSWGHPDLQGVWDSLSATPLERPKEFEGREFLTDEEYARLQREEAAQGSDRAPQTGETGTYNAFWVPQAHVSRRTSLLIDPPDGQLPAFTENANKRFEARLAARRGRGEADSPQDRNLWERCISYGGLPKAMHNTGYNGGKQIFQSPDYVAIHIEMIHDWRIIPLDGRPHLHGNIRQWMGDSRGRWEGDTLVVETTNFVGRLDGGPVLPIRRSDAFYQGSGETLRLTERFTRIDDATIDYRYTVDDPEVFVRPYTVALPLVREAELHQLFEYACHEGNYALKHILSGARGNEQEALRVAQEEEARLSAARGRRDQGIVD